MKTATLEREVSTNAVESNEFTIKANSKAFSILIDGLYADKIQSITREIWSNAYDAHCDAGRRDVAFDVTLPTFIDPSFRVRDYGTGLSHTNVMKLYTTVFESSKEDTNDQVGKLGLGSKSPFSYTDSFSVTSYFNGEVRYYSAMINAKGIPTISLMGKGITDEGNGLEVSFPVENKDVGDFTKAIHRTAMGFDVKPNLIGAASDFEWENPSVLLEGDGFKVLSSGFRATFYGWWAKMGCVLYPINTQAAGIDNRHHYPNSVLMEFDVGDLEITASREALSYGRNEPTSDSIKRKVAEVMEGIQASAQADIDTAECFGEVLIKRTNIGYLNRWVKTNDLTWKGRSAYRYDISQYLDVSYEGNYDVKWRKGRRFDKVTGLTELKKDTIIFVENKKGGPKERDIRTPARINKYLDENSLRPTHNILWVRYKGSGQHEAKGLSEFLEAFSNLTTVMVADIEDPGAIKNNRGKVKVKRLVDYMHSYRNYYWEDTEVDMEDGGYYVKISNNQYEGRDPWFAFSLMKNTGNLPKDTEITVVPKTYWKKFEEHPKWKDFSPIAEKFRNKVSPRLIKMAHRGMVTLPDWMDLPAFKQATPLIKQLNKEWKGINNKNARRILNQIGIGYLSDTHEDCVITALENLKKGWYTKYPLLKFYNSQDKEYFNDYITMVNQSKGTNQ